MKQIRKGCFNYDNGALHTKDAINDFVVSGYRDALNTAQNGTKASAHYELNIVAGGSATVKIRLTNLVASSGVVGPEFDEVFGDRESEADEFYSTVIPSQPFGGRAECLAAMLCRAAVVEAVPSLHRV
jgi:hypothetical protein